MWHAGRRREEWILIQVSALPQRSQPVLRVEEPLHIGGLPSKHLLQCLQKHKMPPSCALKAHEVLPSPADDWAIGLLSQVYSKEQDEAVVACWRDRPPEKLGTCLSLRVSHAWVLPIYGGIFRSCGAPLPIQTRSVSCRRDTLVSRGDSRSSGALTATSLRTFSCSLEALQKVLHVPGFGTEDPIWAQSTASCTSGCPQLRQRSMWVAAVQVHTHAPTADLSPDTLL